MLAKILCTAILAIIMRKTHVLMLGIFLILSGCQSWNWNPFAGPAAPAPSKLADDYRPQLDIYTKVDLAPTAPGTITPTLHGTITNIGNRNVDFLKLVIVVDSVFVDSPYHDIRVVKPLTGATGEVTLLPRDGGATSFIVTFNPWHPPTEIRPDNLRVEVKLMELTFK